MTTTPIHGTVAPGFEAVERVFHENFAKRNEIGAACAAYYRGEKVVDLWGGYRDAEATLPWEETTLVLVFSTTKGVASLALALAHSRGLFGYEDKVSQYWHAFAQNGKENITIRQLLSHQAGLCAIDETLTLDILADTEQLSAILAAQKPAWTPGTQHGYHALTMGWYESELLRHVDPQRRTIGQFFRDEIARPLDVEFYIGLPDAVPDSRIATLKTNPSWKLLLNMHKLPPPMVIAAFIPSSLTSRAFRNPPLQGDTGSFNTRAVRRVEMPAANGIGQVRSIAKAYSEFATGGKTLGIRPETLHALTSPAQPPAAGLYDLVLRTETQFSLGFIKPFGKYHGLSH
jgi:CubicO group peptidase (beta-lactamase class C family)